MRILLYILILKFFLIVSCETIDCKKTEFSTLLNGNQWKGYVKSCYLDDPDMNNNKDFQIIINESNPVHDKFKDALILNRIPFEEGQYFIDSLNIFSGVQANFLVLEDEYGTPTQRYSVLPFTGSFITVEEIDLQSNTFVVKFELQLSVHGGVDGELHNSTYGKVITFTEGEVSGQFMD